ncbi:unnamed protein product [Rhizophagus irregularis]|nr:unnamed protein product [Rhizophagus irregularis]
MQYDLLHVRPEKYNVSNENLHRNKSIIDKTNALEFELYAAIGQIDGCEYPIAYLFLNNAKKSDGIQTAILTEFFQSLKQNGLINLSASFAKLNVDFIDENFASLISDNHKILQPKNRKTFEVCPKNFNEYFSTDEIWIISVKEMYDFYIKYDLRNIWAYMWMNWYQKDHWILWARAANSNELCLFKTTMLIESHWKVVKQDFLPKFFRPRLDLMVFIIINRLLPHHQQYQFQILQGRVMEKRI